VTNGKEEGCPEQQAAAGPNGNLYAANQQNESADHQHEDSAGRQDDRQEVGELRQPRQRPPISTEKSLDEPVDPNGTHSGNPAVGRPDAIPRRRAILTRPKPGFGRPCEPSIRRREPVIA
jgi:hypothetical protein